jgi:hypothetical protein
MNRGRKKINKCQVLGNKLNFTASKAIIDVVKKKITSLGIESWLPTS